MYITYLFIIRIWLQQARGYFRGEKNNICNKNNYSGCNCSQTKLCFHFQNNLNASCRMNIPAYGHGLKYNYGGPN